MSWSSHWWRRPLLPPSPAPIRYESQISWGKKRGAPERRAPQSYFRLHANGSLQGEVGADTDDAECRAAADAFRIIGQMQAEHPEADVGAERPGDVRLRAADTRVFVPAVVDGEIGLDAESRCRNVDADGTAQTNPGKAGIAVPLAGARSVELQADGNRQQAAADHAERRLAAQRREIVRRAIGLPEREPTRERQIGEPDRGAGTERGSLAHVFVGHAQVAADHHAGAALRIAPVRHPQELGRRRRRNAGSERQYRQSALHSNPPTHETVRCPSVFPRSVS